MADSKIFRIKEGMTVEAIGREIENFLRNEKELTVDGLASHDGYLVQAKETSTWKKFTGMGKALQVQIIPSGSSEVIVNIGMGEWADKAGAAAVGALLFAPLLVTSAIGAYNQNKLPSEIFDCVERFIISGGHSARKNVSFERLTSSQVKCSSCGAINTLGTKFCSECGNRLTKVCPSCGEEIAPNKKFCPNCGASMLLKKTVQCPDCGAEIEAGKKFCPDCGKKL